MALLLTGLSGQDALAADTVAVVAGNGASPQDAAASAAAARAGAVLVAGAEGGVFDAAMCASGKSKHGTLAHWDKVYGDDLRAFREECRDADEKDDGQNVSHGDAGVYDGSGGECWYGDDVTDKMVDLVLPYCKTGARVLDVGTGNGDLLCRIVETSPCHSIYLGTDYSPDAVNLAQALLQRRGEERREDWAQCTDEHALRQDNYNDVEFLVDDVLHSALVAPGATKSFFDVFLDKGTLDAMSCLYADHRGTEQVQRYLGVIASLGKPGHSVFALTTANFTQDELGRVMQAAGWEYVKHVRYPRFSFGGGSGVHVNTVLYRLAEFSKP